MSHASFAPTTTTGDDRGELFGVHIPELQLSVDDYRAGLVAAGLEPGEHYLELGSGHGIGLVIAAREFEADAHGVEYLEDAIATALERAKRAGVSDCVQIERDDVRRTNVSAADVLHMHLGPAFHDVLAEQLETQLQPTARVVAAGWQVPGWLPLPSALETWESGYVYRPADPKWQLSWHEAEALASDAHLVTASVHADLVDIEVRVDGPDAAQVVAIADRTQAGRGTELHIAVQAPGRAEFQLSVWGRSRSGRMTHRGDAWQPHA